MLKGSRLHKRIALVLLAVVCLPFTFLLFQRDESMSHFTIQIFCVFKFEYVIWFVLGGAHLEEELTAEIAHLRQRVSQVEMINQARRRDLVLLTQHVNQSLPWSKK